MFYQTNRTEATERAKMPFLSLVIDFDLSKMCSPLPLSIVIIIVIVVVYYATRQHRTLIT